MALARLIADLEPVPRTDVTFLFTSRFDCNPDEETIRYVARKFPVLKHRTKRMATGWPNGPNQMMADSYEHIVERWRRKELAATHVLFAEADCVPLHRNWISMLNEEWAACDKKVLGPWLEKADATCRHINGNCIISIDFWKKCPHIFHPPSRGGWDAALAYAILPNGKASKLMFSDYQLGRPNNPWKGDDYLWLPKRYGCPENPLYGQDLYPVWYHGPKTMDGINAVRKRLLNESTTGNTEGNRPSGQHSQLVEQA
jgi:hypothetical protein